MRKFIFGVLGAASVAVSSHALAPENKQALKAAAVEAHHNCLREQAAKMDDYVSVADTVGLKISIICDSYLDAIALHSGPYRSKREKEMVRFTLSQRAPKTATIIVLEGRKKGNSQ